MTAGVPQGSVIGPTLWNTMYDGIFEVVLPPRTELVGYADDVTVIIRADDTRSLNRRATLALGAIDSWLKDNELELAPHKTEAVVLKGPRKREGLLVKIRDTPIEIKKAIKCLGIWLDTRGTFGVHVMEVSKKVERRVAALSRLMPNIGGSSFEKRRALLGVFHSTVLYGASIWHEVLRIQRYRMMLQTLQRKLLLRMARAYKTVSTTALQVITGTPPIDLLIEERSKWEKLQPLERTPVMKRDIREQLLTTWQYRWDSTEDVAQRTKKLIPDIRTWMACKHKHINYFICQFLTGHGSFRTYTRRIGKEEVEQCVYCPARDTPPHTVMVCPEMGRG